MAEAQVPLDTIGAKYQRAFFQIAADSRMLLVELSDAGEPLTPYLISQIDEKFAAALSRVHFRTEQTLIDLDAEASDGRDLTSADPVA